MHPSEAVCLLFEKNTDIRLVTIAEVKTAFRRRVRMYHPDASCGIAHQAGETVSSLVLARDALVEHLQTSTHKLIRAASNNAAPVAAATRVSIVKSFEKLPKNANEHYYSGVFPTYKLKFGQFLYVSKEISWQDLVRAIHWQRDQRPAYGEIAKAWGWLTERDIRAICAATELPGMFGERAVALGLLTEKQAAFLVRHQHHCQPRLGEYFVKERILLPHEVIRHLKAMQHHNSSIERGSGPAPLF